MTWAFQMKIDPVPDTLTVPEPEMDSQEGLLPSVPEPDMEFQARFFS